MKIILDKKPKNPVIIEGFPGFGLVATIACEFLLDHLKAEQIGKILFEEAQPMVAIHQNKVVDPLGIFYDKEYNIVILHAVSPTKDIEWKLADAVIELAKQLDSKEIICIEGVGAGQPVKESQAFYYTSDSKQKRKFEMIGLSPLQEGIIIGVSGALLLKYDGKISCIFSEAHTQLPDSKAAAKIIETLDKYLGLQVDYQPLLKQATVVEDKLRTMLEKGQDAQSMADRKWLSYVG